MILPPDIAKRPVTTIAIDAIKVRIKPNPIETNPSNSEVYSLPLKVAINETNVEIEPATMMTQVEKVLFKGVLHVHSSRQERIRANRKDDYHPSPLFCDSRNANNPKTVVYHGKKVPELLPQQR